MNLRRSEPDHLEEIFYEGGEHNEETTRAGEWLANVILTELPAADLNVLGKKGVSVYYLPKAERDRWAKQLEPYKEKQLSSFGELGGKIRQIADDVNQRNPYSEKDIL